MGDLRSGAGEGVGTKVLKPFGRQTSSHKQNTPSSTPPELGLFSNAFQVSRVPPEVHRSPHTASGGMRLFPAAPTPA